MDYEEAIARWGAARLDAWKTEQLELYTRIGRTSRDREEDARRFATPTDPTRVEVSFEYDEGYACCGGRDPDCYCTQATGSVAELRIEEKRCSGIYGRVTENQIAIPADEFDFSAVFREIVQTAGGTVTSSGESQEWRAAGDAADDADMEAELARLREEQDEDDRWSAPAYEEPRRYGRFLR